MADTRTCEGCGIKMPPYRSRSRHPETGKLVCSGCHPDKAGSEGRPVGFHGSLKCEACQAPMGSGGLVKSAGLLRCGDGCKIAATGFEWDDQDGGKPRTTYRCTQHWSDEANACGPDHPCEECGSTTLKPRSAVRRGLDRLLRREAQGDSALAKGLDADLVREFEQRVAPEAGEIAVVYRDLSGAPKSGYPAKGSWSIKRRGPQGGRTSHVYAHTVGLHIRNAKPEFDEAARWRATDTTKRAPFAYIGGQVVSYTRQGGGREVSFYPDLGHFFMADDRTIFRGASDVFFLGGKCYAQGAQTSSETVPRSIFEDCPDCGATRDTWCPHASAKLEGKFPTYTAGRRMAVLAGLHDNSWSLLMQVVAHDSGDGQTVYHCPFCGAGQTVARSDGTVECGFCHTYFTVQVQPEHSAMPQTDPATGQPLDMPGMPGDPASAAAPSPTPTETTAPAGGGDFAPAGSGGPEGFAPAGQGPVEQFAPAGSARAASRRVAFYLTPDQVALPEPSYLAHLAIRYAENRVAVVQQVRNERAAR